MDLRISPRGRFEINPATGGFSVVTALGENLSQYLRAAITDQLNSNTFPSIRAADISRASKLAEFKIEAQRRVIDLIMSSPFAYDFDPSSIQVSVSRSQSDSISVSIRYIGGDSLEVLTTFSLDGGRLLLDEELDIPFTTRSEERLIEEELVITVPTGEVDVSCEPTGTLYVCDQDTSLKTETIRIPFKDIPDSERRTAKNVTIDDVTYPILGVRSSQMVHQGIASDNPLLVGIYDSILLSTVYKNRGTDLKVTAVEPVSGAVQFVKYIPSIDDWLIEVTNQPGDSIELSVSSIESLDTTDTFSYVDNKTVSPTDRYPFANEATKGRKYYVLTNILNPGTYTLYYKGLVKPRYNGSIEEV